MSVTYSVNADEFSNLSKVLRAAAPDLGREMRREIRKAAKPIVAKMRAAILDTGMDASQWSGSLVGVPGAGGLRGKIARATRIQASGRRVRIYVSDGALGDLKNIPIYIDAGKKWRHPVFGNREVWVDQWGTQSGWFTDTADEAFPMLSRTVNASLTRFAEKLAARI